MFDRVCSNYGWTVEYCLLMPIIRFFAMHKQCVHREARHYTELADIALISNSMKLSYYLSLKDRYRAILEPEAIRLPEKPAGMVLESGSDDARAMMFEMARGMKRNLGYGRR